jgi:hypothetical protein
MRELSVAEQRYQAVLAVISDGVSVNQVANRARRYCLSDRHFISPDQKLRAIPMAAFCSGVPRS